MDLKSRILHFLHTWTNKNHITGIRKGMVEDLEQFITTIAAEQEAKSAAFRMEAQKPESVISKTLPKEK